MERIMSASIVAIPAMLLAAAIAGGSVIEDAKEKDYKDVPLAEIGVIPVNPTKDAKTGFVVGGKNATVLVRKLSELNGRSIADLEHDMQPGAGAGKKPMGEGKERFYGSTKGFLGKGELLLDVLAMDNEFVVDKLGLTHQDMARPLLVAAAIGMKRRFDKQPTGFRYHGSDYRIVIISYKGEQFSPFYDQTFTTCDAKLENVTNKAKLDFSLLVPQMIERYGFYEGKGTPYRVEPADVLRVFPHLKEQGRKTP
jgi:hypothetical protein